MHTIQKVLKNNHMKKITILFLILIVVSLTGWYFFYLDKNLNEDKYSLVEVTRGDIRTILIATGSLEPVSEVEVGTQVSGRIDKIFVDFNDNVRKGEILVQLDTTFLAASVRDAEATLQKAEAQFAEAQSKYDINKKLYDKEIISELEYVVSKTTISTTKASVQSAKSSLERASTNLEYAFVKSPINGIVIHRNIEQGQTVAASLQSPTLFIIAEDLSKMEILVNVDESDIGQIKEGQYVKFNVQTYSEKEYEGVVKQIRLMPETIQNVVNYTIVVSADNKDGLLLPGMTATVDFYVEEKENVLLFPNSALRFKPSTEKMAEFIEEMERKRGDFPDPARRKSGEIRDRIKMPKENIFDNNFKQIWLMDDNGKLKMGNVIVGLSDGKNSEIVRSRNVKEGDKIICGIIKDSKNSNKQKQQQMPPPPGFGGGFR